MGSSTIILVIAVAALIIYVLKYHPPTPPLINLCTTQMRMIVLDITNVSNKMLQWWMGFLTKTGLNKSEIVSQDPLTKGIQRIRYTASAMHVTNNNAKVVHNILVKELMNFGSLDGNINTQGTELLHSGKYNSDLKMYNSFFGETANILNHLTNKPITTYCGSY